MQTNDKEKETDRSKGERTFEMFSTNGRNAQNGRRSKVEITAQVERKKRKKVNSSITEIIEELGKMKDFNPKNWKTAGNPKVAQQMPPITRRQVATSRVTPPLCI